MVGFHTCGNFVPLAEDLLKNFPSIRNLDVSGWNDIETLHSCTPKDISFSISFINTFVLTESEEEHRRRLEIVNRIAKERKVTICAQAIVRLTDVCCTSAGSSALVQSSRQITMSAP